MKNVQILITAILAFLSFSANCQNNQSDSLVCISKQRLARIAEEFEICQDYQRYATICDSARSSLYKTIKTLEASVSVADQQNQILQRDLKLAVQLYESEKILSDEYRTAFQNEQKKNTKAKKRNTILFSVGAAVIVVETGVIILNKVLK